MPNTINNVKEVGGIIAKAAAKMLADQIQFTKSVAKADESDYKGKNGYGAGDVIYVSKPARFTPQQSFDITSSIQDVTEEKVALPLDVISTVGVNVDSLEFASEIELGAMIDRVIKPAVSALAQDVEQRFLRRAVEATYNYVGTPGSTVFDVDTMLASRTEINRMLCPIDDNRFALLDSRATASAVSARKGLFQSSSAIAEQYKMGYVGQADGYTYLESQLLPTHTNGTSALTGLTLGANMTNGATTIAVNGVGTTTTIAKGTILTVAGVNAVHPITKQNLGVLQKFVVTQTTAAVAGNIAALPVSPVIYSSAGGTLQNVSALGVSGATVVAVTGTGAGAITQQNLVFHKNAFRIVSVPLVMPKAVEMAAQQTEDGITVAVVRAWDNNKRAMTTRLDFLGGICADRPEWACRIGA